jgi:hypothetical protein
MAQLWKMKRYEVTGGLGTSQFYGDVGGYSNGENALGLKDITFKQTRFNVNGAFRYFIIDQVAARISFSYIMLHATDDRGDNQYRGYEATTSVFEPMLAGEYYFVRNRERNSFLYQNRRGVSRNKFKDFLSSIDVYAMTGVGGAGYKVNANEALEARDMKNSGFAAVIPLGIGAKLTVDPDILIGIELTGRYAFTDYLDGYTSSYSTRNDVYHTFSVTFNYRIRTARNGLPAFR